jgi:hypothetical protein
MIIQYFALFVNHFLSNLFRYYIVFQEKPLFSVVFFFNGLPFRPDWIPEQGISLGGENTIKSRHLAAG